MGACVVAGGSLPQPEIVANQVIEILGGSERFCFHAAAEMDPNAAEDRIERMRGNLAAVLASHPHIRAAEGYFYRDVFRGACTVPVNIVPSCRSTFRKWKNWPRPPGDETRSSPHWLLGRLGQMNYRWLSHCLQIDCLRPRAAGCNFKPDATRSLFGAVSLARMIHTP